MPSTNYYPMVQYHDLLERILEEGIRRPNRTGVDTYFIPGEMLKFDLRHGFPAITTKQLAFKNAKGELLGFFRGYTNADQFSSLGCNVWYANANETVSWVNSPYRLGPNENGRIYGAQWLDWADWRIVHTLAEAQEWKAKGYEPHIWRDDGNGRGDFALRGSLNQLETALRTLIANPTDRRIIISAWRPDEFDRMSLPPCHVAYQFLADTENKVLHMTLWQRSYDSFLAYNIPIGAMFLEIMARLSGYTAGSYTFFISDCHIYTSHIAQVKELLSRDHYPAPSLVLNDRIKPVTLAEIPGVFSRIEPADITLEGYRCHPPIKAPMAA